MKSPLILFYLFVCFLCGFLRFPLSILYYIDNVKSRCKIHKYYFIFLMFFVHIVQFSVVLLVCYIFCILYGFCGFLSFCILYRFFCCCVLLYIIPLWLCSDIFVYYTDFLFVASLYNIQNCIVSLFWYIIQNISSRIIYKISTKKLGGIFASRFAFISNRC
jgi:hypothetical protein